MSQLDSQEEFEVQAKVGDMLMEFIVHLEDIGGASPLDYFVAVLIPPFARIKQIKLSPEKEQLAHDRTVKLLHLAIEQVLAIVEEERSNDEKL